MIYHIVAINHKGVIGSKGKIPWQNKEDLADFKKKTTGNIVVMGRTTADSIGKKLNNRVNIVVSTNDDYVFPNGDKPDKVLNVDFADEILNYDQNTNMDIFIIGGSKIYEQTDTIIDGVYISSINDNSGGDTIYKLPRGLELVEVVGFETFEQEKYVKID